MDGSGAAHPPACLPSSPILIFRQIEETQGANIPFFCEIVVQLLVLQYSLQPYLCNGVHLYAGVVEAATTTNTNNKSNSCFPFLGTIQLRIAGFS